MIVPGLSAVLGRTVRGRVALGVLLLGLQRMPLVQRTAQMASEGGAAAVALLRSALALTGMGAFHAVAGATQLTTSPGTPASATVGQSFSLAFAIIGAPASTRSYEITGTLPPGLAIPGLEGTLLNGASGAILGTPTAAGSYVLTVRGWELPNKAGLGGERSFQIRIAVQSATGLSPPVFIREPFTTSAFVGASVVLSTEVSGSGPITFQWSKDGVDLPGATGSSLTLTAVTLTSAGLYRVTATNPAGPSVSGGATLFVNPPPTVSPTVVRSPSPVTIAAGSTAVFEVVAAGSALTYQWRRDGQVLPGETSAHLLVPGATAASAGMYSAIVRNSAGTVVSGGAALTVVASGSRARLTNLSVRSRSGEAERTLIAGFAVEGSGAAPLVVRAVGPTLATLGVPLFLADPRLEVFDARPVLVAANDDWTGSDGSAVGGFPLPVGSRDAVASLAVGPGGYTAQIFGRTVSDGEVIVEVYEVPSAAPSAALVNLSARTYLGEGQILFTGFNLTGTTPRAVLIRAVGPGLTPLGVAGAHGDPKLELFNSASVRLAGNDQWGGSAALVQASAGVGAFPLADPTSNDAVLLMMLPPGGYTAQIAGAAGASGVTIVEVYALP